MKTWLHVYEESDKGCSPKQLFQGSPIPSCFDLPTQQMHHTESAMWGRSTCSSQMRMPERDHSYPSCIVGRAQTSSSPESEVKQQCAWQGYCGAHFPNPHITSWRETTSYLWIIPISNFTLQYYRLPWQSVVFFESSACSMQQELLKQLMIVIVSMRGSHATHPGLC